MDQRLSVSGWFLCCGGISRSSHPLATHATARASQAAHRRRRCSLFSLPVEQTTRAFVLLLPLLILVCLPDLLTNESVRHLGLLFGREFAQMLLLNRQLLPRGRAISYQHVSNLVLLWQADFETFVE